MIYNGTKVGFTKACRQLQCIENLGILSIFAGKCVYLLSRVEGLVYLEKV